MDVWSVYVGLLGSMLALCVFIPVCKGIAYAARSFQERREQAQRAAQEAQRRREQEQKAAQEAQRKAAEKEEKRRAAAEKKRKAEERARINQEKRQEKERRQAEKLDRARQLAEYQERALQAEKELQAIRAGNIPAAQEPPAVPEEKPMQEPPAVSLAQFAAAYADAPRPFKGQTVSFTGTLYGADGKHVPRAQAIQLVKSLGGQAYETMPAGTTLLVVGDKPGMNKLDRANEWIGQVRKITPAQFWAMCAA